jgi:hypothetical protein
VLVGQPVSSGGINPVNVAISPLGLVYVANSGNGGSDYTGFRLSRGGALTPVGGSTVAVPDGSGLDDVFFNALGDHLVGTRSPLAGRPRTHISARPRTAGSGRSACARRTPPCCAASPCRPQAPAPCNVPACSAPGCASPTCRSYATWTRQRMP